MAYALEDEKEFERLERQSKTALYDPKLELEGIDLHSARRILDAGSGSGIVSRLLASTYPKAQVLGIEQSELRVKSAQKRSAALGNLQFRPGSVTDIKEPDNSFDAAICRFVLEHLSPKMAQAALGEMFRCLKPGGQVVVIDIDGLYHNLYPRTPRVQKFVTLLDALPDLDLQVGRKLPDWLVQTGFTGVTWRIETMEIRGQALETEAQLIEERFVQALPKISQLMGSETEAKALQSEFLTTFRRPGGVLFYNKFIVRGSKPSSIEPVRS